MTIRTTPALGLITILLFLPKVETCQETVSSGTTAPSYNREIEQWRAKRIEELAGEDGWLSLVGLFWLNPGQNRFGSASTNEIVLPKNRSPRIAGSLWLENGIVRLQARPGAGLTHDGVAVSDLELQSDADGKQTVLKLGSLKLYVIKRGEKLGLRVKDAKNPARFSFSGIDHFPLDLKWRVKAKFQPYNPPKLIPVVNVLGMVEEMTSPGLLIFNLGEETYRLEPVLEKGESHLFVIFADKTTGKDTYGAGRYLYADPPAGDGTVILDFNKAHNPPCAYTRFATCPLPPKQNRLPVRVEAGEKGHTGSKH